MRSLLARVSNSSCLSLFALSLVATTGCFKWGDVKHQERFTEASKTLRCKGTVTGDLTTTFYCSPLIMVPEKKKEETRSEDLGFRQLWVLDSEAGFLAGTGMLLENKIDPAGSVREVIVRFGTLIHNENNRLLPGPDFEVGQLYGTVAGAKTDIAGQIELIDAASRTFNKNGWILHLHRSEGEKAHEKDVAPDFSTKLVLTDVTKADPHGTLDATLVEATDNGPGPGRAKLHIDF